MGDQGQGWASPRTAEAYASFCRNHTMYAETSRDLVALAGISGDASVVDVACGTGQTTEAILSALGAGGRVAAVDSSEAMLAVAQRIVDDPRVRWHLSPAEQVAAVAHDADAVVCNSAIWQTDMAATFASVNDALRPGGRFVCNIGRRFLMLPFTEEELNPTHAPLHALFDAIAVLDYGHVPRPMPGGRGLTVDRVVTMLQEAGLHVVDTPELRYEDTVERQRDWLRIPIFTERTYPTMTVEQRLEAVDKAYDRADHTPGTARWIAFVAEKPAA